MVPTAQHHDGFSLWDSAVNPVNAKHMGPKRDLIGELCRAVRKQHLKFGVSNHGIENFQFINPPPALADKLKSEQADLYDPQWVDFYHVADRSDAACEKFLEDWYARNVELIDKYQPDMLWFDNGVDIRFLDPLKLRIAAYYYNRAQAWGKEVSIGAKKAAYAPSDNNTETIGSILDFEKIGGRSPSGIRTGVWQVDEPIGSTWGYTSDMRVSGPGPDHQQNRGYRQQKRGLHARISPQRRRHHSGGEQATLLAIGEWLRVNGEAIYDTHGWIKFGEGGPGQSGLNIRFTVNGEALYAIILGKWPGTEAVLTSLADKAVPGEKITSVTMLGADKPLAFTQDATGLKVELPATAPCQYAYVLKLTGLKMNPPTWTQSGNPQIASSTPPLEKSSKP